MKISLCIPMYNETSIIADTAKTLTEYMTANFPGEYEIIFSDDGSTDGSADLVRGLALPGVRVQVRHIVEERGCTAGGHRLAV